MSQSLQTPVVERDRAERPPMREGAVGSGVQKVEQRLDAFVAELGQMTPEERIRASRYSFDGWERSVYAARYPDEVPLVNGELEWIAATLECRPHFLYPPAPGHEPQALLAFALLGAAGLVVQGHAVGAERRPGRPVGTLLAIGVANDRRGRCVGTDRFPLAAHLTAAPGDSTSPSFSPISRRSSNHSRRPIFANGRLW